MWPKRKAKKYNKEGLMTFAAIGKELGISGQFAYQIYLRAIWKLRARFPEMKELLVEEPVSGKPTKEATHLGFPDVASWPIQAVPYTHGWRQKALRCLEKYPNWDAD